jgi:hypothetical protein
MSARFTPPPAPAGILAYAENATGTAQAFTTTGVDVTGCTISVPATSDDVWLEFGCDFQITTAGAGALFLQVIDITSGGSTVVATGSATVLAANSGSWSVFVTPVCKPMRIGPLASARQYKLTVIGVRDAASTLAASVRNSAGVAKSYLAAVAK